MESYSSRSCCLSLAGLIGLVCVILIFYDGQYKRLACERANAEGKAFLVDTTDAEGNHDAAVANPVHDDSAQYNASAPLLRDRRVHQSNQNEGDVDSRVVRVGSVDNSIGFHQGPSSARPSESWSSPSHNVSVNFLHVFVCLSVDYSNLLWYRRSMVRARWLISLITMVFRIYLLSNFARMMGYSGPYSFSLAGHHRGESISISFIIALASQFSSQN